jgi:hypothetical protein
MAEAVFTFEDEADDEDGTTMFSWRVEYIPKPTSHEDASEAQRAAKKLETFLLREVPPVKSEKWPPPGRDG